MTQVRWALKTALEDDLLFTIPQLIAAILWAANIFSAKEHFSCIGKLSPFFYQQNRFIGPIGNK